MFKTVILIVFLTFTFLGCGKTSNKEDVPPLPEMLKNYSDTNKDSLPIPSGAITLHYQWFYDMEIIKWQLGDEIFLTTFKRNFTSQHSWAISTIQIIESKKK